MLKIISPEIVEENGLKYKVDTYNNGAIVKAVYTEPSAPTEPELSEMEETIMDTNTKVSYIECLMELSGGGLIDKLKRLMQHCLAYRKVVFA